MRVDVGGARRQELGTAPATSKVVVRIQKHHHAELYSYAIAKTGKKLQSAFDFENRKKNDDIEFVCCGKFKLKRNNQAKILDVHFVVKSNFSSLDPMSSIS